MRKLSDKLVMLGNEPTFWCPGCSMLHRLDVSKPNSNGAQWTWNGDVDKPTFSPSLVIYSVSATVCHSFIRDGKIEYLSDSKHALAGQTIEMPDLPEWVLR